eukprot:TRINITY_DN113438_c0_g1_i1.p1 TRINITY_DN113438_c0_g1~~TRINITY_DN113438_c0_g1_i1.p1  ORF type:complete len:348 (-),score=54.72 TRINITY_DN113438_c0_g1_i1:127-1170(-)
MGNQSSFDSILAGHCHDLGDRAKERLSNELICHADGESEDEIEFDDLYKSDPGSAIGTGKFSTVYICYRRDQPAIKYAMKVIDTASEEESTIHRIQEEILILQTLQGHPGIVQLIQADDSMSNCIRLILDLCEGGDLFDRIQKVHHYPEWEARMTIRNLLSAVAYFHSRAVMHRDLKPENILLIDKSNNVDIKVSDFGLARISKDPTKHPRSNTICGSDFYLAPEIIMQQEYGREVDVWAVGVITYIVLSGSLPFFNKVLHKLYRQIVERDLSFAEPSWKGLSKGVQDFILRVLQIKPGERPVAGDALQHPWLYDASQRGPSFTRLGMEGNSRSPEPAQQAGYGARR